VVLKVMTPKVVILTLALNVFAATGAYQESVFAEGRTIPDDVVVPDTTLRTQLRPPGNFHDLVQRLSDRLMHDPPEDSQCKTASELGFAFWWMTDLERQTIDERMLHILVTMLKRDSNDYDRKCIIRIAGTVLGHIGPRARSALPALKAELAELESNEDYQRAKKARATANPMLAEGSLELIFQGAIASIERNTTGHDR
jgi:hypothetical protein